MAIGLIHQHHLINWEIIFSLIIIIFLFSSFPFNQLPIAHLSAIQILFALFVQKKEKKWEDTNISSSPLRCLPHKMALA